MLTALAGAEVPAGPLLNPQQVLDDPHIGAVMLERIAFDGSATTIAVTAPPVRMGEGLAGFGTHPPALGEHTDEMLGLLGYEAGAIADLRVARII